MPRMVLLSVFVALIAGFFLMRRHEIAITGTMAVATGLLAAMLAWTGITMIQSINTGDAFTEWVRLAVHSCLFFCLYLILSENVEHHFRTICRYAMIAVLIFCAIGIYQGVTGWEKRNEVAYSLANTVWSTLSNKNFFSECLILFLPFLVFGIREEKGYWKVLFFISVFLSLIFILIIQSAGAWFALIVGGVSYFILTMRMSRYKLKKYIPAVLIVAACCVVFFYLSRKEKSILSLKIKSVKEYLQNPELINITRAENNNSVFERLILLRNAIRMIKDHPVTGVGLNNWKIYNPSYGIGGTQFTNTGLMNYEHPHNDYLLILAEEGPAGLIIYLLFIVVIIRSGIRTLNQSGEANKRFVAMLICGVITFSVLSLVSYPRSRAYQMLLLMITSSMILSFSSEKKSKIYVFRSAGILILILGVAGVIVFSGRVMAEIHTRKTILSQLRGNFPRMYSEAVKAGTWLSPLDIASTPLSWYKGMARFYMQDIPAAITEYEKAVKIHPYHLRVLNDLATSYEKTGRRSEAIVYYKRALAISPLFVEGNMNISAAYYNSGNIDSAYYYINRIKEQPKSMSEEKNYKLFVKAIMEKREELRITRTERSRSKN